MLLESLITQEKYYVDRIHHANRFTSLFRGNHDHTTKLSAVRKLMKDINDEDVWYTKQELDILNSGKLRDLLQKYKKELPTGFVNSKFMTSNKCR